MERFSYSGFPPLAVKAIEAMRWTFHEGELGCSDVRDLLDLHFREMRSISPPGACHVLGADNLSAPDVTFCSIRQDGLLLGIGALKELSPSHGELKSMRTAAPALGMGVGSAMLEHILGQARDRGYMRVSLETGSTPPFSAALRLYEREGFARCGPFGGYATTPFTRFFTRAL